MGNEHQQRQKVAKADLDSGPVSVQAVSEQSLIGGLRALPGLGRDAVLTLHGSIGNAAVARLAKASDPATESPTPVSSGTQDAIDAERGNGRQVGGAVLHNDANAQALASSLNASAFTQGRDVFLGAGAGASTLTHEMMHVSRGAPSTGAVMREPADTATAPAPTPSPAVSRDPEAEPGAAMGPEDGEVRYVDRLPTIGEPGIRYIVKSREMKLAEKRYTLSYTMYDKPIVHQNLTAAQAVERLKGIWYSYHGDINTDREDHLRLKENREDHWIVGFWSDTFGGVELPDLEIWNEVGRGSLAKAMAALQESDAVLEEHWKAKDEEDVRRANMDPSILNNPFVQQAREFDPTEQRILEAISLLEDARAEIAAAENKIEHYRTGTIRGGARAIVGIRVSIALISAAAAGNNPITAGFLGSTDEFFTQVGEMRMGDRKDWDFDFGKIAKRGAKDTVTAFVGAVVGGKFSKALGGKYTQWVYGLTEAEMAAQGVTREMLLTKGEQLVIDWVAGVGASPFTTTSNVMMDMALDNKVEVKSFGDFAGKVWDDMVQNAEMDGLLKLAGAKFGNGAHGTPEGATSSTGGETASTRTTAEGGAVTTPMETAGGGGGSPPTTSTPGSTGGGGEGSRPSSDIGTADTQAMPVADVGTADTLQMPAESGKGPGDTEPMTAQEIGNLDTQTMAAEDISTRDTAEQTAVSDTLPHDVASAPTQQGPAQTGTADTQPQPAQDSGTADTAQQQAMTPEGANATPDPASGPTATGVPEHPIPPANGQLQPIERVEASRIAAQASREGTPGVRWVAGGPAEANRVWHSEYGGTGDAPAAWVPPEGGLVVNTNEIPATVRSADIVSGPIREPGAAVPAPEAAGGNGEMTQSTGQSQASESTGSRTMDTGASSQEGSVPRPGVEGLEARINRPKEFGSVELIYETNDAFEASQMSFNARARGRNVRHIDGQAEPERLADAWRVYGGSGEPPVAFMDNYGNVIVDVARAPDAMGAAAPQGPVANPGREIPSPDAGVEAGPESAQEAQSYPDFTPQPGEGRGIDHEVTSPSEAGRLIHEENVAGRPVRVISDGGGLKGNVDMIYRSEYGGTAEETPVAWVDDKGYLVVNVDRVDYGNYPTATPY